MANPQAFGRTPPADLDSERAALGALMGNDTQLSIARVECGLTEDMFYFPGHSSIFRAMAAMAEQDKGYVDPLKLTSRLRAEGILDELEGGVGYLGGCLELCPIEHYAPIHFRHVRDLYERRRVIDTARAVVDLAYAESEPGFLMTVPQMFHDLMPKSTGTRTIEASMEESFGRWRDIDDGKLDLPGLPTGFPVIDQELGGLQKGFNLIAARPSAGKTSLEGCIVNHLCKLGIPVARVSMDMRPMGKLLERDICRQAGVSLPKLNSRYSGNKDFSKVREAIDDIKSWPMYINDDTYDIAKICSWARLMKQRHNIQLLTLDYIQLCTAEHIKSYDPVRVIGYCAAAIKALGEELEIPILCLAQLNRENARDKRRPQLSDLKGSGDLEQHASTAILLSKEEKFDYSQTWNPATNKTIDERVQRAIYCDIAKNQQGGTGALEMWFYCNYFRMETADRDWGFSKAMEKKP